MIWNLILVGFFIMVSIWFFQLFCGVLIFIIGIIFTALGGACKAIKEIFK